MSVGIRKGSFCHHNKVTVEPGQIKTVTDYGEFFLCSDARAVFQMSLDSGERFDFQVGLSFRLKDGDFFKTITFYNPQSADIDIEYFVGVGEVRDARLNILFTRLVNIPVQAAPTLPKATTVGAGQTVSIANTPPTGASGIRKQISVYNPDFAADSNVLTPGNAIFAVVYPRSPWTHETDAVLQVQNNGSVDMIVGETYYV